MKMKTRITVILTALMVMTGIQCNARDFWALYGERLMHNYAVRAGTGADLDINRRLSSDEIVSIATKSFSQSFGTRVTEIAMDRRGALIVCAFTKEPDRCYLDAVLEGMFNELHFMNAPGFSQKFIKKAQKFYSRGLFNRGSLSARRRRATLVPPWKSFNPLFGIDLNGFEIVASTPFYTYFNIYVEPQYGTSKGFSLGFMKDRWYLDVYRNRATLSYRFHRGSSKNEYTELIIMPGFDIQLENTFIVW